MLCRIIPQVIVIINIINMGATKLFSDGLGLHEDVLSEALPTESTNVDMATSYTVSDTNVEGKICAIGKVSNV